MLSVLPGILFLAPFSATLIRIALAIILGLAGWTHFGQLGSRLKILAALEVVTAALIFVGAWTQIAAIVAICLTGTWLFAPGTRTFPRSTVLLSFVLALSLLVTGAGAIAFDFPL